MATINEVRRDLAAHAYNEDPPSDLYRLIVATGEWIEKLTGEPHAANAAMHQLLDALNVAEADAFGADRDWRADWADRQSEQGMRRGQDLTSLMAFAGFGIDPDTAGDTPTSEGIEAKVTAFREFVDSTPSEWGEMTELQKVALSSEARILIDTGRTVSPEQLAALAGMGLRSLKNLLGASNPSGMRPGPDGRVPANEALAWLQDREDFQESVWMDPNREVEASGELTDDEFLFVPVAGDGSAFTPDCRRDRGYEVGLKGEEDYIAEYREALAKVATMTRPAWRRPNDKGNWGIVRAHRWERRSASSLGLAARA